MAAIVEGEGRKPAQTDEERAALLRTMFAYSGMYRLDGDKWITKVDVSWNPAWNGTEQVRFYKLDGNQLEVTAAWGANPNLPGSPITRGVVLFERGEIEAAQTGRLHGRAAGRRLPHSLGGVACRSSAKLAIRHVPYQAPTEKRHA